MTRSLVSIAAGLAAIAAVWWLGFPVLAIFLAVVCGLAALLYLVAGSGERAGDGRPERERKGYDRVLRDVPPSS